MATTNLSPTVVSPKNIEDQQLTWTIRLIMQGKEVGSIIGKRGDNIKRFREESGAKINISDGSCPERIVTISGTAHEVFKAFSMICRKFEETLLHQELKINNNNNLATQNNNNIQTINNNTIDSLSISSSLSSPSLNTTQQQATNQQQSSDGIMSSAANLASQLAGAGSLSLTSATNNNNNNNGIIGSLGIQDSHNDIMASMQHSINSLSSARPHVSLRLIIPASQCGSLIGRGGAKIKEIREITGATIQVASEMLPNSTERTVTVTGSVESLVKCVYQICSIMLESPPKGFTVPYRPKPAIGPPLLFTGSAGQAAAAALQLAQQYAVPSPHADVNRVFVGTNQLAAAFNTTANIRAAAAALSPQSAGPTGRVAAALSAAVAGQSMSATEMTIPNGLIGCVIGKGGSKINEIRQLSGANIKISNSEEGTKNRTVTISGTPEAINVAQYVIWSCLNTNQCE